jgi:hypothetical protein
MEDIYDMNIYISWFSCIKISVIVIEIVPYHFFKINYILMAY